MESAAIAHHLLDLPPELVAVVAAQVGDATALCRLAQTCHLFHHLIHLDEHGSSRVCWEPLLRQLGVDWRPVEGPCASARLYRAFDEVRVRWTPLDLIAGTRSAALLEGRTGSAGCVLSTGAALMYGGALNGNFGPVLSDLLTLEYDRAATTLTVRLANLSAAAEVDVADGATPGPRRGHTFTAANMHGRACGCILGGWGAGDEVGMAPWVLTAVAVDSEGGDGAQSTAYAWSSPQCTGMPPEGRAFHSATCIGSSSSRSGSRSSSRSSTILVYGGLGSRCCRTDIALLDLGAMAWSRPRVDGVPRCDAGRAGHGAFFFPSSSSAGGELLLVSGASRSPSGDRHQNSVDVLRVAGASEAGAAADADAMPARVCWSSGDAERGCAGMEAPAVRTASYAVFGRSVVAWGGIDEEHDALDDLTIIDFRRRIAREAPTPPPGCRVPAPQPRGGGLCLQLSPTEALMLCGSDHNRYDDSRMLTPWVLELEVGGAACG